MIIDLPAVDLAQAVLGRRLRRVREARGFTVRGLAAESRLAPARLGLAEQGRTRLTSAELHALIGALHISLGLLHGDADVSALKPLNRAGRPEPRSAAPGFPADPEGGSTMGDQNQIQGEGDYVAGRRYQQAQHEFAKQTGKVDKAAREAEDALDGPEGEELERARRETGEDQM